MKSMSLILVMILLIISTLLAACSSSEDTGEPPTTPTPSPTLTATDTPPLTPEPTQTETITPKPTQTESSANPIAIFQTSMGTFKIELFKDKVPVTVDNFIKLVNDGFYDGIIFHRIKDDFMIQAGMETTNGTVKTSPYGVIDLETHPEVTHVDGAISMARTTAPNSATSQFFICDGAQHLLDDEKMKNRGSRGYAAFGVVIEGIEVVRDIAAQPHDNSNPAGGGIPLEQIVINSIKMQSE